MIRFSRDECTPEEERAVKEWLDDGTWPDLPRGEEISEEIKRVVWAKIKARMHGMKRTPKALTIRRLEMAAAVVILVATAAFIYTRTQDSAQALTYMTTEDQQKQVVLPDSSVVFLSPSSSIKLAENYSIYNRKVYLSGKASFEVVSDASHPFVVVSGDIVTTALGTSFQVNSYPERAKINVVLSYGKVRVTNKEAAIKVEPVYLKPGEEIVFDKTSATIKKKPAKAARFSYENHILYFKNAGLNEVVEKLERFYQVAIDTSQLGQVEWKVSGEFKYQPLEVVMNAVAYSCGINYAVKGNKIVLKHK